MDDLTMDEQTLFNDALEKRDPRERAAYLAEACGRDDRLRQRVEGLLALHDEAGDFLERPAIHQAVSDGTTTFFYPDSSRGDALEGLSLNFLRPGETADSLGKLGPYEVTGIIGRGAMAVVLKADDAGLRRMVAVKVLAPELAADSAARKRFLREGQAAAAVVHPHVVAIHGVGEEDDLPYLVMEYVDGVSLDHTILEDWPLPTEEIVRIGSQVADGLAAAHRRGLIHRDIKPANILLEGGDRRVKITDFGLARAAGDASLTRTGEVAGTPLFMSPEQAEGRPIDQRTDLFSLGSVLYLMCTGRQPFLADSPLAVMRRVCDDTPRPIRELNPDIPEWLVAIVNRLLRKDPAARFQTAQEVTYLLRRRLDERTDGGRPPNVGTGPAATGPAATGPTRRPPTPLDKFLADVRLVHRGDFSDLVGRLSTGGAPLDVARLAEELVRFGALTRYQAAALYQGRGRGLVVGPYVLLDKIGRGGMGIVFKAVHRELQAVVALKLLPPTFQRRKREVMERFRREAEALARIQHPNIVSCYEHVKEADGIYYHVMEYVEGRDLKYLVENQGVFSVAQAIDCLLQTARGLQAAHSLRVIHRDIKPANLMLDHAGTIRILDFGLARVSHPDPWVLDPDDEAATRAVLGTVPYISPEQGRDAAKADARSDIYSLGCTLYFLLTGRPPYRGRTWSEMLLAHRHAPIPSLKAARRSVPDHLDDLFRRMLAKDPADRPRTMASVIASIELASAESRTRPPSSQTIPVRRPDGSDAPDVEPAVRLEDLEIESISRFRRKEIYYTGRRIRPRGIIDPRPLVRYLLLAAASIVVLILLIELLLRNAWGEEPMTAATEARALICARPASPRSLIPGPAAGTGAPPGRTAGQHRVKPTGLVHPSDSPMSSEPRGIESAATPRASTT
jgi:serine/threonine protein kinase